MMARSIDIFGSSSAQGYYDPDHGGFAGLIKRDMMRRTEHRQPNAEVVNYARSSMRLPGILKMLPGVIESDPFPEVTSHFGLFMVGSMESAIVGNRPDISPAAFAGQLVVLSEICERLNMRHMFIGPPPIAGTITLEAYGTELAFSGMQAELYDDIVEHHAQDRGVPYVSVARTFAAYPDEQLIHSDGRHPNPAGHARIYERVIPDLGKMMGIPLQPDPF